VANAIGIWGVTLDLSGNFYTSLFDVHQVLKNNATVLVGSYNTSGNTRTSLNKPRRLFFDESTSSLFVCDSSNHRIQKFQMNSSVGVTVAGGNGQGSASDHFNVPNAVWVSPKTGFIYVADTDNHRIQLWKMNATQGITIAGNGTAGNLTTMLNTPQGVALNANETFLYVSEQDNHRVQRFNLLCLNSLSPANQSATCINQTLFI
jgi:sugar lactone lactonase YvrE